MEDIQVLARDRILKTLGTDTNYLGYWTVPVEGSYELHRAVGIDDAQSVTMVIHGVSVSIDGLSVTDNSRYGGSQRRKQQTFNIYVDHWLIEDIDLTNELVSTTLLQYPGLEMPDQVENFGVVLDVLMDSLVDWDELQTVRKPLVRQRSGSNATFPMARAVIGCVGNIYGEWVNSVA